MKFRKKPVVVEAVQLTSVVLDASHPSELHLPGVVYDPKGRCAFFNAKGHHGCVCAELGDWIVLEDDGGASESRVGRLLSDVRAR